MNGILTHVAGLSCYCSSSNPSDKNFFVTNFGCGWDWASAWCNLQIKLILQTVISISFIVR